VDAVTRFALGEASADEQIHIAAHLRDCAVCADEVELTRAAFREPAPGSGLVGAIERVVAMLAQPAPGVRSGHDAGARTPGTSYVDSAGDVRVSLLIDPEDDAYVITGVLSPVPNAPARPAEVESIALLYAEADAAPKLVAQAPVTPSNDFDLHDVPAGTYRLEIVRGSTLMVLSPVTVP
jgi:hypothetical protein